MEIFSQAIFLGLLGQVFGQLPPENSVAHAVIRDATICSPSAMNLYYKVKNPTPCVKKIIKSKHTCNIKAYAPKIFHIPVQAYICTLQDVVSDNTFYFWGEKISVDIAKETYAPTIAQCLQMEDERRLDGVGFLRESEEGFFQTDNKKNPWYRWCTKTSSITRNAFLERITAFWDITTNTIQSHLFGKTGCNFTERACSTAKSVLIWKNDYRQVCKQLEKKNFTVEGLCFLITVSGKKRH